MNNCPDESRKKRKRRCQGQRISNQAQLELKEAKKLKKNRKQRQTVSSISEQLDSIVVMLGGEVREGSRRWWRKGKSAERLIKFVILEESATYLSRLTQELEEVKSKKALEVT